MDKRSDFKIPDEARLNSIPGWDDRLETAFSAYKSPYVAGRVAARHKKVCDILIPGAMIQAAISGAMRRIGNPAYKLRKTLI